MFDIMFEGWFTSSKHITYKDYDDVPDPKHPQLRKITIQLNKKPDTKWIEIYTNQHNGSLKFGLGQISDKKIKHNKIQKEDIADVVESTKSWIESTNIEYSKKK